jgi:hypothetical protein
MSHSIGDEAWVGVCSVGYDGTAKAHVLKAEVVAVIDGTTLIRYPSSGTIRPLVSTAETLCDNESDAWAAVARELAEARDRVQAGVEEATAKAAGSRVGEAVAT